MAQLASPNSINSILQLPSHSLPSSPKNGQHKPIDRFPSQNKDNSSKHLSTSTVASDPQSPTQLPCSQLTLPSSPRAHQRTSSASYLSGTTMASPTQGMGSPDALLVPSSPVSETKPAGFFKRLRSRFRRRSLSPPQPQDAGLNITEKEDQQQQQPEENQSEETSPVATVTKPSSLNPFKRKKKDEDWMYYEAVEHWTDDW